MSNKNKETQGGKTDFSNKEEKEQAIRELKEKAEKARAEAQELTAKAEAARKLAWELECEADRARSKSTTEEKERLEEESRKFQEELHELAVEVEGKFKPVIDCLEKKDNSVVVNAVESLMAMLASMPDSYQVGGERTRGREKIEFDKVSGHRLSNPLEHDKKWQKIYVFSTRT